MYPSGETVERSFMGAKYQLLEGEIEIRSRHLKYHCEDKILENKMGKNYSCEG